MTPVTFDQKVLMELFMQTMPKTVFAMECAQSLRKLHAEGRVEFFIGDDQQVRARLLEPMGAA
jgi:hypothetical protein